MKATKNNEAFIVAELLRFCESQSKASAAWHRETLEMWKKNAESGHAHKAYREAVRRINDATGNFA